MAKETGRNARQDDEMSKIDNVLSCIGLMLEGASLFGLAYGMRANNVECFKWGLLLFVCTFPLAVYIAFKSRRALKISKDKDKHE
jgi:hypothetical protein